MKITISGLIAFLLLGVFTACTKDNKDERFNNQLGKVKAYSCSRGCYQYLISVSNGTNVYFPINLRSEYKVDGLSVIFNAEIKDSIVQIYKPSSTDIPIPDFTCNAIKLTMIQNTN